MQKVVLTFGLIGGVILAVMMMARPFHDQIGFDRGVYVGYTTMVLAFLMVYFGVQSYRDNVAGGSVTFGRAFKVGLLISLVIMACYVATWQVMYYNFMPDSSTSTRPTRSNRRANPAPPPTRSRPRRRRCGSSARCTRTRSSTSRSRCSSRCRWPRVHARDGGVSRANEASTAR